MAHPLQETAKTIHSFIEKRQFDELRRKVRELAEDEPENAYEVLRFIDISFQDEVRRALGSAFCYRETKLDEREILIGVFALRFLVKEGDFMLNRDELSEGLYDMLDVEDIEDEGNFRILVSERFVPLEALEPISYRTMRACFDGLVANEFSSNQPLDELPIIPSRIMVTGDHQALFLPIAVTEWLTDDSMPPVTDSFVEVEDARLRKCCQGAWLNSIDQVTEVTWSPISDAIEFERESRLIQRFLPPLNEALDSFIKEHGKENKLDACFSTFERRGFQFLSLDLWHGDALISSERIGFDGARNSVWFFMERLEHLLRQSPMIRNIEFADINPHSFEDNQN